MMARFHPFFALQTIVILLAWLLIATSTRAEERAVRVVSLGGGVTEIVYALGEEERLVARDTTSNYPESVEALPDVGYIRRLSAEGVLSVDPDLIIADEGAGPPEAVELLKSASIPIVWVPDGYSKEAVLTKITVVSEALGVAEKGKTLADDLSAQIDAAVNGTKDMRKKRVLFVLSMAGGRIMAAGTGTSADGIITLAGGKNAASAFEGWKPMTDEAIIESGAEVILMMSGAGDRATSDEELFSHPAIAATPAGQNRTVLRMDGMLLTGFSVRTAEAIGDLANLLRQAGS